PKTTAEPTRALIASRALRRCSHPTPRRVPRTVRTGLCPERGLRSLYRGPDAPDHSVSTPTRLPRWGPRVASALCAAYPLCAVHYETRIVVRGRIARQRVQNANRICNCRLRNGCAPVAAPNPAFFGCSRAGSSEPSERYCELTIV